MRLFFLSFFMLLASCSVFLDFGEEAAPAGEITGAALVLWVGPNDESQLGSGEFLYIPRPGQEITITRAKSAIAPSGYTTIVADSPFFTDGGSIPRAVQWGRGLNAWSFGPAYILHDWLFVVRKCVNDDMRLEGLISQEAFDGISEMKFPESARLMAETIRGTAEAYQIAPETELAVRLIAPATASSISYRLWNQTGACDDQKLQEAKTLAEDTLSNQLLRSGVPLRPGAELTRTRTNRPVILVGEIIAPTLGGF